MQAPLPHIPEGASPAGPKSVQQSATTPSSSSSCTADAVAQPPPIAVNVDGDLHQGVTTPTSRPPAPPPPPVVSETSNTNYTDGGRGVTPGDIDVNEERRENVNGNENPGDEEDDGEEDNLMCVHCEVARAVKTCVDCVDYPVACLACWARHHTLPQEHRCLEGGVCDPSVLDVRLGELYADVGSGAERHALLSYLPPSLQNASTWVPGKPLEVFVGTWNMESHAAPEDLTPFLPRDAFHIIFIGTQECGGYLSGGDQRTLWEMQLMSHLGRNNYIKVKSHSMMAIHAVLFVHTQVAKYVQIVESAQESTGFLGGALGNKGGVGIGVVIGTSTIARANSTRLLFINCHLTPHQHAVQKRNADIRAICSNLKLGARGSHPHLFSASADSQASPVSAASSSSSRSVVDEYDSVFWCGDLNYRINGTGEAIRSIVSSHHDWRDVLRNNDQLDIERRKGNVLVGFLEGIKAFRPTYKYHREEKTKAMTDDYDRSAKNRIPSWTDRVLCLSNHVEVKVEQLAYKCVQEMKTSDHRPVVGCFRVDTLTPTTMPSAPPSQSSSSTCAIS
eukprot:PhM_4_TR5391/c0_g1_i1/m.84235/K20278/INPP5E; inositol polyphosphate 5-phosphatase INPP5E